MTVHGGVGRISHVCHVEFAALFALKIWTSCYGLFIWRLAMEGGKDFFAANELIGR